MPKYVVLQDFQLENKIIYQGETFIYDEPLNSNLAGLIVEPELKFEKASFENMVLPDIVIPHHDRAYLLKECLESIPKGFNVYIIRGGSFSVNCNKGFKLTKGDDVIFLNDDIKINQQGLKEMIENKADIVGCPLIFADGRYQCYGVDMVKEGNIYRGKFAFSREKSIYPSGAFFKIKRSIFKKLGGFDEVYKNGAEDREMFLKALELGYLVDFIETPSIHHLSKSEGRFDHNSLNENIFNKRFSTKRIENILKKINE